VTSRAERIPLRLIAEKAGVSRMTVSLALRNHRSISKATRERVQAVARELGHRDDPVVSDLMARLRTVTRAQHVETLALVTCRCGRFSWRDIPVHRAYYEGARARAEQFGYLLEEFSLYEKGMTERRLSQILWTRGIAGVLIFPIIDRPGFFELNLDWSRFFAATIAFSLRHPAIHRICVDHTRVAVEAYQQLKALGYRRPGLAIEAHQDERSDHHWRAGFLCAQNLAGETDPVAPLITSEWSYETFARWFDRYQPDAVLGIDRPIVDWIERCGARVPADVGYASLDLTPNMGDVSGMDQHQHEIGAGAVDIIIDGLRRHERGVPDRPKTVMIGGSWRAGATTRKKPRRTRGSFT
jgi:Transcriptional regulators